MKIGSAQARGASGKCALLYLYRALPSISKIAPAYGKREVALNRLISNSTFQFCLALLRKLREISGRVLYPTLQLYVQTAFLKTSFFTFI